MTAPASIAPEPLAPEPWPTIWHRAPGWIFSAVTAVGAVGLLWSATYPYGSLILAIFAGWWLIICAGVWLARLIIYLVGRRTHRSGAWWPFLVAPVAGVLVLAIGMTDVPLRARWAISEGAFDARADALVAEVERGGAGPGDDLLRDDRVAAYTVAFAHADEDGNAFFSIANSGFIDGGGFARLPDGPPADARPGDEFEHLGGDWYLWLARFD